MNEIELVGCNGQQKTKLPFADVRAPDRTNFRSLDGFAAYHTPNYYMGRSMENNVKNVNSSYSQSMRERFFPINYD